MRDVFRTLCRLCDQHVNFKDCTIYNERFIHLQCLRDLNAILEREAKEII